MHWYHGLHRDVICFLPVLWTYVLTKWLSWYICLGIKYPFTRRLSPLSPQTLTYKNTSCPQVTITHSATILNYNSIEWGGLQPVYKVAVHCPCSHVIMIWALSAQLMIIMWQEATFTWLRYDLLWDMVSLEGEVMWEITVNWQFHRKGGAHSKKGVKQEETKPGAR